MRRMTIDVDGAARGVLSCDVPDGVDAEEVVGDGSNGGVTGVDTDEVSIQCRSFRLHPILNPSSFRSVSLSIINALRSIPSSEINRNHMIQRRIMYGCTGFTVKFLYPAL